MPPHKKPKTLLKLCLEQSQALIKTASENIGSSFGVDNPLSEAAIQQTQQHLLSVVGGLYLDQICNAENLTLLGLLKNPKIFFAICMHDDMKEMTVSVDYLKSQSWNVPEPEGLSDGFWTCNLPRLTQLTRLHLCARIIDLILRVVGQHCLKLQYIDIGNSYIDYDGFDCLVNCKDLREIKMNRPVFCPKTGALLQYLPKLKSVPYYNIEKILAEMDDGTTTLALEAATVQVAEAEVIPRLARLCPNLKTLDLTNNFKEIHKKSAKTLTALAHSELRVSDLKLGDFDVGTEMETLLRLKGVHITRLCLDQPQGIVAKSSLIKLIGTLCPNIVSLELHAGRLENDLQVEPVSGTTPIFRNLETLKIKGIWPSCLLPLILTHAKGIKSILLNLYSSSSHMGQDPNDMNGGFVYPSMTLNEAFATLVQHNPLAELQELKWPNTFELISQKNLINLFNSCPQFSRFQAEPTFKETQVYKDICTRIQAENLDFTFKFLY